MVIDLIFYHVWKLNDNETYAAPWRNIDKNDLVYDNSMLDNLKKLQETPYVSYRNYPRHIIPDNCIISPSDLFLKWFNTYENLNNITDNHELEEIIISLNEKLIVNSEELLANYLFYYKNTNNIKYFHGVIYEYRMQS